MDGPLWNIFTKHSACNILKSISALQNTKVNFSSEKIMFEILDLDKLKIHHC